MADKKTVVFGIYANTIAAESAVDRLVATGFPNEYVTTTNKIDSNCADLRGRQLFVC